MQLVHLVMQLLHMHVTCTCMMYMHVHGIHIRLALDLGMSVVCLSWSLKFWSRKKLANYVCFMTIASKEGKEMIASFPYPLPCMGQHPYSRVSLYSHGDGGDKGRHV